MNSTNTDSRIVEDILEGGSSRDGALKYLYQKSGYFEVVKKIVTEGGGDDREASKTFEDCIVNLDRKVRRYLVNKDVSFAIFFESEAKVVWGIELKENKNTRDKVLRWVNADKKLKEQIYYSVKNNSGGTEDAEDCYQNGVILLNKKLIEGGYNGGAIKGFFYQLCFNIWRNELKKSKTLSLESLEYTQPITKEDPSDVIEREEHSEFLRKLFDLLGDSCQKILSLRYFIVDQYNMEDIAVRMGFKNAQIASNTLSKCRKKLWDLMQEHKLEPIWKSSK